MQQHTVKWFDADEALRSEPKARPKHKPAPQLKLLLEVEPAHRVFLGNLADTFLWQSPLPAVPASTLGRFWSDVFVTSRVPWSSFLESMLWHALIIAAVCLVPNWMPKQQLRQASAFRNSSITYYSPSKSFPATKSSPPRTRTRSKKQSPSANQRALAVRREHRGLVTPPDLQQALARGPKLGTPNLAASNPALPAVPLSATQRAQLTVPAGPTAVVAPPPSVNQVMAGRAGLLQGSVVGPAPDVAAVSGRRGVAVPGSGVVAPPPNVPIAMRRTGNVNIGHSAVVGPAPRLPMHEQSAGSGMAYAMMGSSGGAVVPPPPSVESVGIPNGRGSSLSRAGVQVVPPPPSVESAGIPNGRGNSLGSAGLKVVPPAPSVENAGGFGGRGRGTSLSSAGVKVIPPAPSAENAGGFGGRGRGTSLSGTGVKVIPPAPSVENAGGFGGRGRGNSLSGGGLKVIPPPPSVDGAGGSGGTGRVGSLSGGDSGVVPPPPVVEGMGNGTGGGRAGLSAGSGAVPPPSLLPGEGAGYAGTAERPMAHLDPQPAPSPPAVIDTPNSTTVQEVPLRLIGLALALPTSSYFSNYEVFIAERRLGKDATQLIKLVYIYLPYQRRLSEYVQNNARVYKLRVTRDPTCDESMLQMTTPQPDQRQSEQPQPDQPQPDPQPSAVPPELSSIDRNSVLPCYRTTADDYRDALSRTR
jgi:hypothetical protein